jgi:hypothetical protein
METDPADRRSGDRRIDAIARDDARLAAVLRSTEAYAALNRRVADAVPASAHGEIGIARVDGDCLVIAAASPARATQARLAADALLRAARQHWPEPLRRTRVIVAPGISLGS